MEENGRVIAVSIAFAIVIYLASSQYAYAFVTGQLAPWYGPMVTPDEVAAAQWVDANVPHWKLFSADLFACEMITAVARQYCSVGGAWELADHSTERFSDNEKAFTTSSAKEAWDLSRKYGIGYVLVTQRQSFYGYGYKAPNATKFDDPQYFKLIHSAGTARVYEVASP